MKKIIMLIMISTFVSGSVKKASVNFTAVGKPSFIRINGESDKLSEKLTLKDNKISGELIFDLDSLTTGLDLRDRHMKETYLETSNKNFKQAVLKISNLNIEESTDFKAFLTLHGVTKEVKISAEIDSDKSDLEIKAHFEINLSDFGIAIPSFQGITVADSVKINVESEMTVNE